MRWSAVVAPGLPHRWQVVPHRARVAATSPRDLAPPHLDTPGPRNIYRGQGHDLGGDALMLMLDVLGAAAVSYTHLTLPTKA